MPLTSWESDSAVITRSSRLPAVCVSPGERAEQDYSEKSEIIARNQVVHPWVDTAAVSPGDVKVSTDHKSLLG